MPPGAAAAGALGRLFSPLGEGRRAQAVERRITRAIELGALAPGAQLPSEAELAAQLSVSPGTLREALAALRRAGLVETRRGRRGGTFVTAGAARPHAALERRLRALPVDELRDIGDLCLAIRGTAAELAATRAGAPDHRRLRHRLDRLRASASTLERRRAENRFHADVAAAAHSPRLARAELALQEDAGDLLALGHGADHGELVDGCERLVAAIAAREAARARAVAAAQVHAAVQRLVAMRLELAGA